MSTNTPLFCGRIFTKFSAAVLCMFFENFPLAQKDPPSRLGGS